MRRSRISLSEEPWVQLAARIPKSLHKEMKIACFQRDETIVDFVVEAILEKLARQRERDHLRPVAG